MAEAASAHQAATASREESGQQRTCRTRRTTADPQRAQQGATAAAATAPAALDSLSLLQRLADASPRVAQLQNLKALADGAAASRSRKVDAAAAPPNHTGLPVALEASIEPGSGLSMNHLRVQDNPSQPPHLIPPADPWSSELQLAPMRQHKSLHEAGHVVQQAPFTMQLLDMLTVAPPAPILQRPATGMCVVQARWIYVANSGNPGNYYWEGRSDPNVPPPNGGQAIPAPELMHLEDTHQARSGVNIRSLRTNEDDQLDSLKTLAHYSHQLSNQQGIYYDGPTEVRGLGPTPVLVNVPYRDPNEHRTVFKQMSGFNSSTQYQESLGMRAPNTDYEILHAMGHGEGGPITQAPNNLASASHGANTEMIPFDNAISGNPNVLVDTRFHVRSGTHRAERIEQSFSHIDFPNDPFHHRVIDGDRPPVTRSEYDQLVEESQRFTDPRDLDAAVTLEHMWQGYCPQLSISSQLDDSNTDVEMDQSHWDELLDNAY